MKITTNNPKPKPTSNVLKLKQMMQSAINNLSDSQEEILPIIEHPKTMKHSQTIQYLNSNIGSIGNIGNIGNSNDKFFSQTQKIKGISNSITVYSSKVNSVYGSNNKVVEDIEGNKQNLLNSINNKNITNNQTHNQPTNKQLQRTKSTSSLSDFALQLTKKNRNKSAKEPIQQNSHKTDTKKDRKIKVMNATITQHCTPHLKIQKSHSTHTLFHEKFRNMKNNAHIVTKQCKQQKITMQSFKTSYSSASHEPSKLNIHRFEIGKKLGRGRFGNVFMAEDKITGFILAIKIINKNQLKQADMQQQLFMQIKLQLFMDHPNILKLYSYFDDGDNIYLLLELGEECMFKVLRRKIHFEEKQTAYLSKQIIQGLKYLHSQKIIHRDLKPENIMIVNNVVKLADFGWSIYSPFQKRQTFCGTLDYVPPEIVKGDQYDENADIWSLGILIFELTTGKAPFQGNASQQQTFKKIKQAKYSMPQKLTPSLKKLIRQILNPQPNSRLDLKSIDNSDWLRQYQKEGRSIKPEIWKFWQNCKK